MVESLHRDELYKQDSSNSGVIGVTVHKHRHGNIGTARLRFDSRALSFSPIARS